MVEEQGNKVTDVLRELAVLLTSQSVDNPLVRNKLTELITAQTREEIVERVAREVAEELDEIKGNILVLIKRIPYLSLGQTMALEEDVERVLKSEEGERFALDKIPDDVFNTIPDKIEERMREDVVKELQKEIEALGDDLFRRLQQFWGVLLDNMPDQDRWRIEKEMKELIQEAINALL